MTKVVARVATPLLLLEPSNDARRPTRCWPVPRGLTRHGVRPHLVAGLGVDALHPLLVLRRGRRRISLRCFDPIAILVSAWRWFVHHLVRRGHGVSVRVGGADLLAGDAVVVEDSSVLVVVRGPLLRLGDPPSNVEPNLPFGITLRCSFAPRLQLLPGQGPVARDHRREEPSGWPQVRQLPPVLLSRRSLSHERRLALCSLASKGRGDLFDLLLQLLLEELAALALGFQLFGQRVSVARELPNLHDLGLEVSLEGFDPRLCRADARCQRRRLVAMRFRSL
eukprot:scaffold240_cov243-Pinguiococcus_pyrenoidosus.AAC.28